MSQQQQAPWLETAYGWAYGESGWNIGMDSNLLKFSVMFDRNVDSIVPTLPAAVNGQVHYNTSDNRLYFAVGTTYFSTTVPKWFIIVERATGNAWQFNGTSLGQIDSPQQLEIRIDDIELTLSSLGTAAFEDSSVFATQAALDVVSANSASYTDTLRSDLTDTGPTKGSAILGRALVAVGSLADLLAIDGAARRADAQYLLLSFYEGDLQGGGHFVWQPTVNRANADGVMVIDPSVIGGFDGTPSTLAAFFAAQGTGVGTGCWVRVKASVLTPESCGAVADGTTDDATAIAAWWVAGLVVPLEAQGHYVMATGTTNDVTVPVGGYFEAVGRGAIFDVTEGRAHTFRVIADEECTVDISGFEVRANNKASNGIYIQPAAGYWLAERISVKNCMVTEIRGLVAGYWSSSVNGIAIDVPAKLVVLGDNIVDGVNRDYRNPGLVSSIGARVLNVAGLTRIYGNDIRNVQSPIGEVDADALIVFSRDAGLDVSQDVSIHIHNNYFREFKGRGIKLQTTEAHIFGNRFESRVSDITNTTRCIDSQYGGVTVVGNYWDLGAVGGTVSGADVHFVLAQHQTTAQKESRVLVADNFLTIDREIRHLVFQDMLSGTDIYTDVRNNTVKAMSASGFISNPMYRQNGSVANFDKLYLNVDGNTYPSKTDVYVMLDASISASQANGDVIEFAITRNKNTRTADVFFLSTLITSNGSQPYIGKMVVNGNNSAGSVAPNRINCTSVPIANIMPGSNFYLNVGTIDGAPVGFTGTVQVEVEGSAMRLTATNVAHRPTQASAWRLTTTTAL